MLYITPLYVSDLKKTLTDLARIVDLSEDQQRDVIVAANEDPLSETLLSEVIYHNVN